MASDMLTNFVYFTVAMYGFFSVGMISDAKVFYGAASPLCYFTVFDVSAEWFAKSAFFAGVSYETYARSSLPISTLMLPLFIQAALFTTTTGPERRLHQPDGHALQPVHSSNCLGRRDPRVEYHRSQGVEQHFDCQGSQGRRHLLLLGDGTYLCCHLRYDPHHISPKYFWGPDSMFAYWEVNDESGVMFGRMRGILMCSICLAPLCEWALIEPSSQMPACGCVMPH